jgi:peptidyl-prolyl cis-trans isomerase D
MLDFIRSRAQGWVAWVIVGFITVPFALWGIQNYVGGGGSDYVAKVAGEEISRTHFENTYQQHRMQLEQMFGGQIPEALSEQMLRAQVLEQMVEHEMIIQAAVAQKMRISDRQLADVIRSVEAFNEDGRFSQEQYVNLLRRQGMSAAMFEQRVRRDLMAEQFDSSFSSSAFVTPAMVDNFLRLEGQQRETDWLRVKAESFTDQVSIDEADIQAYYEGNSQRYQLAEQVKVDYLEINAATLGEAVEVSEEELRLRYEARLDTYRSPEERRASHILIRVDEDASEGDIRRARERAEAVLTRLREGEDFATLANSESEDPGSASSGGDLGFFGRGMMVPSFEDVAFALETGQVSELVRSPFGFHIIRVEEVRGGELKPFDAVRADLQRELRFELASQRYYDLAERLATYTYEQPDTLQVAAEELGLTVQSSEFLTRQGGPGIGAHAKVITAAFSDDVLDRKVNSEPLDISRDHMIVLRLNEHRPATVRPLDEVRDEIVASLTRERASEMAAARAAELLEQIRTGASIEPLAAASGLESQTGVLLERETREFDAVALNALFAMPRPVDEAVVSQQLAVSGGDHMVLVLKQVIDADPAKADEAQREQIRQLLLRSEADVASEAVLESLRVKTDVKLNR